MVTPLRSWGAAAAVFLFGAAPAAWAGFVTPDSIASPPAFSSAANDGTVAPGGWVTDQYQGAGLVFSGQMYGVDGGLATALVRVNGTAVWTPAYYSDGFVFGKVTYAGLSSITADLVKPGTATPATADSVRVDFLSAGNLMVSLTAYDKSGVQVGTTAAALIGAGVETPLFVGGAGIASIQAEAFEAVIDPPGGVSPTAPAGYSAWGVRSIAWDNAPEPAGLVLAGLGVVGLVGYARKRRRMRT